MTSTTSAGERSTPGGAAATRAAPSRAESAAADRLAKLVGLLLALVVLVTGIVAVVAPDTYRDLLELRAGDAFVHLLGGVQVGLGTILLLAVAWRDALAAALLGLTVGGLVQVLVYALDSGDGVGSGSTLGLLAVVAGLSLVAFVLRGRGQGWVFGDTGAGATDPVLTRFVGQKTVLLTSYKRDGTPVGTPVSIAVDGDRAFCRSFEAAFKTRRIRNNPQVELAPCTTKGTPTGPSTRAVARQLDIGGSEAARAAHLIGRKYPFLHRIMVTYGHKLGVKKTGRTVHFELDPQVG